MNGTDDRHVHVPLKVKHFPIENGQLAATNLFWIELNLFLLYTMERVAQKVFLYAWSPVTDTIGNQRHLHIQSKVSIFISSLYMYVGNTW